MKKKEYPMDEKYTKALEFLTQMIAERDEMRHDLKFLSPEDRPEALRLLRELDIAIEKREQILADDYKAQQEYQRALEEEEKAWEKALHHAAGMLIHMKYRHPEKFEEAFDVFTKGWSNQEIEEFDERMAKMEEGDLVRIIRRQGETRKQAEAFLKNFRIEEEKQKAALFEELLEKFSAPYVRNKYREPETREKFDEIIAQLKPEQIKEFYDLTTQLETHHLMEIITLEGETREEAKEFLKNFRRQKQEEGDETFVDLAEQFARLFILAKYRDPDYYEEMKEGIIKSYSPEEEAEFYDRVAELEAGDLVGILTLEGETREEIAEFLKNYLSSVAKRDEVFADIAQSMAMMFIHVKYRLPDKFEEMEADVLSNYTPEEKQEFYDRIAELESGDLISLIARQGETLEETEEFLKNYRAAQNK